MCSRACSRALVVQRPLVCALAHVPVCPSVHHLPLLRVLCRLPSHCAHARPSSHRVPHHFRGVLRVVISRRSGALCATHLDQLVTQCTSVSVFARVYSERMCDQRNTSSLTLAPSVPKMVNARRVERKKVRRRILQQNSLAQHWARDWRALALTQVHHGSRLKRLQDSCEDGEALSCALEGGTRPPHPPPNQRI